MSAPALARPPTFTTDSFVEVDIDPSELEDAGWVYVGKGDDPTTETLADLIHDWHDREHPEPWRTCGHELCRAVTR